MRELFSHFEVNREPNWPILAKLVVVSLAFHVGALASVFYVPGVRDSLNIAALLAKTDYVDRPYTLQDIGEDIRVVEVEKFRYPDGYFATEAGVTPEAPAPFQFTPNIIVQEPQPTETPLPSPSPSPESSPSPSSSVSGSVTASADNQKNSNQSEADQEKVEQQLDQIAKDTGVVRPKENEVNTRPLKDWLAKANLLREKGELKLDSKVEITISGELGKDCGILNADVVQKSGDERLVGVAKEMVAAIGASGMLSFLRDPQKVTDASAVECTEMPLTLSIKLDEREITAQVISEADSATRAAELARGYGGLLAIGQLLKRGRDEEQLYKSTKVTSEGKQVLVNFSMPRQAAGEMLKKQLPSE